MANTVLRIDENCPYKLYRFLLQTCQDKTRICPDNVRSFLDNFWMPNIILSPANTSTMKSSTIYGEGITFRERQVSKDFHGLHFTDHQS